MSNNLQAELYRIAEEAHKGVSDSYVKDLCKDVANHFGLSFHNVYARARAEYARHFARPDF